MRWELGESENTKMKIFQWVFWNNYKIWKKIQFLPHFWWFLRFFFIFQWRYKILKIQKNRDFPENQSKIEFWRSDRSKSSSFWKYRFWRSFWCIYHSYNSIFHLVWIFRSCRPGHPKIRVEFRRIDRTFKKFSWKIESVWE